MNKPEQDPTTEKSTEIVKTNKGGRPSKYPKYPALFLRRVRELAETGMTEVQIAKALEISPATLTGYKKKKEFLAALKQGKRTSDGQVVRSLFERATGYTHPEEKIFCNNGEIIKTETMKHYPPDPTSMIFWLKNRDPENWRDKVDHNHSGNLGERVVNNNLAVLLTEDKDLLEKVREAIRSNGDIERIGDGGDPC